MEVSARALKYFSSSLVGNQETPHKGDEKQRLKIIIESVKETNKIISINDRTTKN